MFPLNDFNFVACALATFSAAVGYKYSQRQRRPQGRGRASSWASESYRAAKRYLPRRYSSSSASTEASTLLESDIDGYPSDAPTPSDIAFDETEPGTLKRKHRDELRDNSLDGDKITRDASSPPPQKRFRTSTPEADEGTPHPHDGAASPQPATPPPLTPEVVVVDVDETPADAAVESTTMLVDSVPKIEIPPVRVASPPASPTKLESTFTIPACKPSTAFSAFAGTSSGFGSSFTSATSAPLRPAWCALGSLDKPAIDSNLETESGSLGTRAQTQTIPTAPVVTGEEDEDVEAELKGVKLLIKRGDKDFTDGILGHIKLLSHKETKDERIVFRREPVWKVSMSVRLRPTVRCIFDEEHGVLRFVLKEKNPEFEEGSSEDRGESVVIYALRRGKVSKSDFADFAKGVVASTGLESSSGHRRTSPPQASV